MLSPNEFYLLESSPHPWREKHHVGVVENVDAGETQRQHIYNTHLRLERKQSQVRRREKRGKGGRERERQKAQQEANTHECFCFPCILFFENAFFFPKKKAGNTNPRKQSKIKASQRQYKTRRRDKEGLTAKSTPSMRYKMWKLPYPQLGFPSDSFSLGSCCEKRKEIIHMKL